MACTQCTATFFLNVDVCGECPPYCNDCTEVNHALRCKENSCYYGYAFNSLDGTCEGKKHIIIFVTFDKRGCLCFCRFGRYILSHPMRLCILKVCLVYFIYTLSIICTLPCINKRQCVYPIYTAVKSQNAVSAYFLLPFGFAELYNTTT